MADLEFRIDGMTCATCVNHVAHAVRGVPGVARCEVNLTLASASVSIPDDVELIGIVRSIEKAVDQAGFEARWVAPEAVGQETAGDSILEASKLWRRRFGIGLLLGLPVVIVEMVAHTGHAGADHQALRWINLVLTTAVMLVAGGSIHATAWRSIRRVQFPMDVLVSLGTLSAYLYSGWVVLARRHDHGVYFESAAVIIVLVCLGRWLEHRAKHRAGESIRLLMDLAPPRAVRRLADGREEDIPLREVNRGDILVVRPGGQIPTDATIIEGNSTLDVSMLTGEWNPVPAQAGTRVQAGTLNGEGMIILRAEAIGGETALARIIAIVRHAQASRAPVQAFVDKVTGVFVPAILVLAVLTFLGWGIGAGAWTSGFLSAIAVLVVACPCALGLATPMALVVGSGVAAGRGILFRDIESIEAASKVDVVVLDKTGTLTKGQPTLSRVVTVPSEVSAWEALRLAASIEAGSEHPLARAIVDAAKSKGVQPSAEVTDFRIIVGGGAVAIVGGKSYVIGSPRLLEGRGATLDSSMEGLLGDMQSEGMTTVLLAREDANGAMLLAVFGIEDQVRPEATELISDLMGRGVRCVMMTGDNRRTAAAVASKVGLDEWFAEVQPDDKAQRVIAYQAEGRKVAMVGDGINDSPALACASLGIAIGSGTDIARETAGVTLLRHDIRLVAETLRLGVLTMSKIRQNLFWAFAYNVTLVPLAMIGMMAPMFAGAAMALSSLSVVINSLAMRRGETKR